MFIVLRSTSFAEQFALKAIAKSLDLRRTFQDLEILGILRSAVAKNRGIRR
jgi:hypothetical protein